MNFKDITAHDLQKVEERLKEYLVVKDEYFPELFKAMEYTTMAGGKRIRACICLMFARLCGGSEEAAINYACAVEMVHAYSLIHDDLPCMDNDDMRRGKPSNHIVFGEAPALLAGDGLLTYAFEVAASNPAATPKQNADAVKYLAYFAGPSGMVGGQSLDLIGEQRTLSKDELHHVHALKTGALIEAAAVLGCCASEKGEKYIPAAKKYALNLGLVFQIIDDILDVTSDEKTLGKPIGSDKENNKTTYLTYMSSDEAKEYAFRLNEEAKSVIDDSEEGKVLKELADFLLTRNK